MGNDLKVNMNEYLPLRDVVFNTLRQAILKGELAPGERLMEIQLANTDPRGHPKAGAGRAGSDDTEKGSRGCENLREEPAGCPGG